MEVFLLYNLQTNNRSSTKNKMKPTNKYTKRYIIQSSLILFSLFFKKRQREKQPWQTHNPSYSACKAQIWLVLSNVGGSNTCHMMHKCTSRNKRVSTAQIYLWTGSCISFYILVNINWIIYLWIIIFNYLFTYLFFILLVVFFFF